MQQGISRKRVRETLGAERWQMLQAVGSRIGVGVVSMTVGGRDRTAEGAGSPGVASATSFSDRWPGAEAAFSAQSCVPGSKLILREAGVF